MKTFNIQLGIIVIIVCITLGCSSAPPQTDEVFDTRNRAAEYAEFGHRYFEAARYDKALEFYLLSLDNNIAVDSEAGIIKSKNSIGKVHLVTGKMDLAAKYFDEALLSAQALGDPTLIAMSSSHIGEYFMVIGDTKEALIYFDQALSRENAVPDKDRAILMHNAGTAYRRSENYAKALDLFGKALTLNEASGHLAESASNKYMIASVHAKMGDNTSALKYAQAALEDDKKAENSVGIAKDHRAIGLISEKIGDTAGAFAHYQKAHVIYEVLKIDGEITKTLKDLVRLATLLGRKADAAAYESLLENAGGIE